MTTTVQRELAALLGADRVLAGDSSAARPYLADATESRAIRGAADAITLPADAAQVAAVVAWCYEHDVPIVPRGGGTGYSGGAVPLGDCVVLGLERLRAGARVDPGRWRAWVPAGVPTADVRRLARESGLMFAPDPGAAEQSTIGGNIATNAGGPHAFKYGVTGAWVTGVDVVLAPGEPVSFGGPIRKDTAGYDLKALMIGSEGTLGVVTGAWLRLLPAPEAALPVVASYPSVAAGCSALDCVLAAGLVPAALEFLAIDAEFVLIADADGSLTEATRLRDELREVMSAGATSLKAPTDDREVGELWRWRDGVSLAVVARRGGKVSEDIVVPVERLREAIEGTVEIGARHRLPACSWGHAGDGNLHATVMIDPVDADERARAQRAGHELFELAVRLGGSVSGEHGIGLVKRGALALQWSPAAIERHEAVKRTFDRKGLLNPGKKLAR